MKKTNNDGPTPGTPETPGTPGSGLADYYSGNSGNLLSFRSSRSDPSGIPETHGKTKQSNQERNRRKKYHEHTPQRRVHRNRKITRNRPRNPGGFVTSNLRSSANAGEARPTAGKTDHEYTG